MSLQQKPATRGGAIEKLNKTNKQKNQYEAIIPLNCLRRWKTEQDVLSQELALPCKLYIE